jgi:hypothetical protein
LNYQYTLKIMKYGKVKQVLSGGKYQGELGRGDGEGEGERILWKYFVYVYENGTMKPVELVRGRGGMRENNGGGESN